ncbi:MAG: TolC family protein [Bacteroidota bacterium]
MKLSLWLSCWWLLLSSSLPAQSVLDTYVAEGIANNLQLKQEQLAYEQAAQALAEAKSLFLPQVSLIANYTLAGGGRAIEFPVGDLFNPVYATLNELTESNRFPTDLKNVNEQFLPNNFHETKVRVIQPLFNSDIYLNRRLQEDLLSVEEAKRAAYRAQLSKDIRLAYFDWLKSGEAVRIYAETQPLLEEIRRVNERLVANQKATREVIAAADHELSKLAAQQVQAHQQQQMAQAYFNFLLNRPLEHAIEVDASLPVLTTGAPLSDLEGQALNSRQELQQLEAAQVAAATGTQLQRNRWLPQVNAVVDAGFQGFGYNLGEQGFWLGQVALQWDLFEGGKKRARVAQARIQQENLQQQHQQLQAQLQLQVRQAFYQLEAAQAAHIAAREGLASAQQVFGIRKKQYQQNLASLLELLDARTQLTQAQLQLALTATDQHRALAELRWAAGEGEGSSGKK